MSSPKIQKKISRSYHAKSEADRRAIVKRRERTTLKRHGVRNAGGTEESIRKKNETLIENYGSLKNAYKLRNEKSKETCLKRYGVDWMSQLESAKEKARKTWMRKYGVPSPMQNPEVFQRFLKSGYRKRWVRFKDGTRLIIQSNAEQFVVRNLLKQGWKVEAPDFSIPYKLKGHDHRYHPDFVISKGRRKRVIEVKSPYTLEKDLRKNLQKFRFANKFCERRGMKFILCILSGVDNLQRIISPTKAEVLNSLN